MSRLLIPLFGRRTLWLSLGALLLLAMLLRLSLGMLLLAMLLRLSLGMLLLLAMLLRLSLGMLLLLTMLLRLSLGMWRQPSDLFAQELDNPWPAKRRCASNCHRMYELASTGV